MIDKFLPKKPQVIIQLAQYLLEKEVGDRIDSIRFFEQEYNWARGTVQNAFQYLKDTKAISLVSAGRNGTHIQAIDYNILLEHTGINQLIGAMPLPYSKTYEGLATGLYAAGSLSPLPIRLAYMRGSLARIQLLLSGGCDFIVLSEIAAESARKKGYSLSVVRVFDEQSYMQHPHVLLLADKKQNQLTDGMRLGYDEESLDLEILTTELAKNVNVQLIDMKYHQLVKSIDEKNIDAAIWNADELIEKQLKTHYVPLPEHLQNKTTRAVLATKAGSGIARMIEKYDPQVVMETQQEVIQGKRLPVY